jgi:hypothetical protein
MLCGVIINTATLKTLTKAPDEEFVKTAPGSCVYNYLRKPVKQSFEGRIP